MPAPSRDAIAGAVGKCIFLKLAPQDTQKLLAPLGAKVDWEAVGAYTAQAVRSPQAAACLSGHFTEQLAVLNAVLEPKLFLGGASPCLADIVLTVALHGCFAAFDDQHKWALCNASRWFDLLQHRAVALGMPDDLKPGPPVTFVYDAPEPLPAIESLSPLIGVAAPAPAAAAPAAGDAGAAGGSVGGAGGGKERPPAEAAAKAAAKAKKEADKEKKAAKKAAAPAPAGGGDEARAVDVSWLDMRVGHITAAEAHPESDKLYVETIDLGEPGGPRQVLSGLAQYLPIEAVRGARVVVLCNLGAKKLGGVESQGMVLCAKNEAGLGFVTPPDAAPVGERVCFEGFPGEPESNPKRIQKKKAWEACMADLATDAEGVACYRGVPFATAAGKCTAAIKSAPIS